MTDETEKTEAEAEKTEAEAEKTADEIEKAVVRTYKDSLFRMIFSKPKELLALYNALNGSNYTDENQLEFKTLENAIYMNIKNDVSFIIDSRLSLYEHQSTYTPNMPLRDLFYVADQLQAYVKEKDLYGRTQVKIPASEFVVFYNGTEEQLDRKEFRLSDAYVVKPQDPKLELKVLMLNINLGHNEKLMEECKTLRDYAMYVHKVRTYAKKMKLAEAVNRAVDECIRDDVLKEFLLNQKAEAIKVTIYEFDQAKHDETLRNEGRAEGRTEGRTEGREEGELLGETKTLLLILSQYGTVPENLREALQKEADMERLDEMVKKALQLQSVEAFADEFF